MSDVDELDGEEYGGPLIDSPATRAAAALVDAIYKYNCVGGNAHIVVDDENLEDVHIRYCLDEALRDNVHEAGPAQLTAERAALEALLALTIEERWSAMRLRGS